MSVKGHLALLVGVFVVALAAVTLIQRSVAGELGAVARDLAGSSAPKAHAARELSASQLVERRALAEADRLLADQQAAATGPWPSAARAGRPRPGGWPGRRPPRPGTGWSSCCGSSRRRPAATSTPTGPGPSGPRP
jgi:hypothetical protein